MAENSLGLLEWRLKVMPHEGNMGDEREFDANRLDIIPESLGLKRK
ncbi:MAG: hypothetical protein HY913_13335 [Desulfomonile tiedjei]|nr:hypothetical protein [Desulfomonile tiedjei]